MENSAIIILMFIFTLGVGIFFSWIGLIVPTLVGYWIWRARVWKKQGKTVERSSYYLLTLDELKRISSIALIIALLLTGIRIVLIFLYL